MKKNNTLIATPILVVLQILCLFAPEFIIFPKYTWIMAFMGILVLFISAKTRKYVVDSTFINLMALIGINVLLSFFTVMVNRTSDLSYIVFLVATTLSFIRNILLIYAIYRLNKKGTNLTTYYIEIYIYACVVYVIFTMLFIIFPEFKAYWLNDVIYSQEMSYHAYEFRYSLNGFAAFSASTIFSIAVLFNAFLIIYYHKNKSKFIRFYFTYVVLVVGCFFYGRITIASIAISVVFITIFLYKKSEYFKIILLTVVCVLLLMSALVSLEETNESFAYWSDWAFAIIEQLFSGEGITDHSVTHMFEDMYYLPETKTFIIGDGRYNMPSGGYYGKTDVGFMRAILFFGIVGCLINYSMVWMMFLKIKKESVLFKPLKGLILFLFLVMIVLEMKGEAYHQFLTAIVPIYYLLKIDQKEDRSLLSF